MSSSSSNLQNFTVRTPIAPFTPNRAPPLRSGVALKQDMGHVGGNIPSTALLGHTIVISPTGAGLTYTLPTASSLLYQYGRNSDNTGLVKTDVGNMIPFNIVNTGTFPATLACNATGGDSTGAGSPYTVTCATGATMRGKITPVYLQWLEVNSGVNGATGLYTLYN